MKPSTLSIGAESAILLRRPSAAVSRSLVLLLKKGAFPLAIEGYGWRGFSRHRKNIIADDIY
jgi:hypothetical protein